MVSAFCTSMALTVSNASPWLAAASPPCLDSVCAGPCYNLRPRPSRFPISGHLGPSHIVHPPASAQQSHHTFAGHPIEPSTAQAERTVCDHRSVLHHPRHPDPPGCVVPYQRGPRIALGVAQVDDQRNVAVVDADAGEVDDPGDALLFQRSVLVQPAAPARVVSVPLSLPKVVATPLCIFFLEV